MGTLRKIRKAQAKNLIANNPEYTMARLMIKEIVEHKKGSLAKVLYPEQHVRSIAIAVKAFFFVNHKTNPALITSESVQEICQNWAELGDKYGALPGWETLTTSLNNYGLSIK